MSRTPLPPTWASIVDTDSPTSRPQQAWASAPSTGHHAGVSCKPSPPLGGPAGAPAPHLCPTPLPHVTAGAAEVRVVSPQHRHATRTRHYSSAVPQAQPPRNRRGPRTRHYHTLHCSFPPSKTPAPCLRPHIWPGLAPTNHWLAQRSLKGKGAGASCTRPPSRQAMQACQQHPRGIQCTIAPHECMGGRVQQGSTDQQGCSTCRWLCRFARLLLCRKTELQASVPDALAPGSAHKDLAEPTAGHKCRCIGELG